MLSFNWNAKILGLTDYHPGRISFTEAAKSISLLLKPTLDIISESSFLTPHIHSLNTETSKKLFLKAASPPACSPSWSSKHPVWVQGGTCWLPRTCPRVHFPNNNFLSDDVGRCFSGHLTQSFDINITGSDYWILLRAWHFSDALHVSFLNFEKTLDNRNGYCSHIWGDGEGCRGRRVCSRLGAMSSLRGGGNRERLRLQLVQKQPSPCWAAEGWVWFEETE